MRFSERYGYKKVRDVIQIDSMDETLRNTLWTLLDVSVWHYVKGDVYNGYYISRSENSRIKDLFNRMWIYYFKLPLDTLEDRWQDLKGFIREYFFECNWYEIYDFVEFVANNYGRSGFRENFIQKCNTAFEREMSAYRFVDGVITRITEKQEIESIEEALDGAQGPVRTHLRRALELLSDREKPDYRNSIKESISAIESLVSKVVGKKGTLGQLIKKLDEKIGLHSAIKEAFGKLYGYSSDQDGIRHAILESDTVTFDDAKFFLVTCSAFATYVEGRFQTSE